MPVRSVSSQFSCAFAGVIMRLWPGKKEIHTNRNGCIDRLIWPEIFRGVGHARFPVLSGSGVVHARHELVADLPGERSWTRLGLRIAFNEKLNGCHHFAAPQVFLETSDEASVVVVCKPRL